MPEVLTEREDAVVSLVTRAAGAMLLDWSVVDVHKLEGGQVKTLRFTLNDVASTDLERARIESGNETPEQLASVVIAELKRQMPGGQLQAAGSLLLAEGVGVKVVSEMLGHADITTTLRIYSHALPSMQEQAANAMDRLFGTAR